MLATPKASEVQVDAVVPRMASTRATHAPVNLTIYKWTSNAGDAMPDLYADKAVGLYQSRAQQMHGHTTSVPSTPRLHARAARMRDRGSNSTTTAGTP